MQQPHINPPSSDENYEVDPYSAAVNDVMRATQRGLANSGAMSELEYEILKSIQDLTARA